jgi:hypothetical protein
VILGAALTAGGGPGHDSLVVAVQSGQDGSGVVVMRTKLVVPAPRARSVPRLALREALAGVLSTRMLLVCAPTGWGKTSLLAEWAAASSEGVGSPGSRSIRATMSR